MLTTPKHHRHPHQDARPAHLQLTAWLLLMLLLLTGTEAWAQRLLPIGTDTRKIVIGLDNNYPPLEYVDANGRSAGYDVDFTNELMRRLNISYTYLPNNWAMVGRDIEHGRTDLAMMLYSPYRQNKLHYSSAVFKMYYEIIYRKSEPEPLSLRGLKGHMVAMMSSHPVRDTLEKIGARYFITEDLLQAVNEMSQGRFDAVICFRHQVKYLMTHTKARNLTSGSLTLAPREYCYVSTDESLIKSIDVELEKMERDGTTKRIYGEEVMSSFGKFAIPEWIYVLLATMAIITLTVILTTLYFRRKFKHASLMFEHFGLSIAEGLIIYDKDGNMVYINSSAADMLGIRDTKAFLAMHLNVFDNPLLGKFVDREHPEKVTTLITYKKSLVSNTAYEEFYHIDEDITAHVVFNVVREDDHVQNFVVMFTDVTDQIRTQKEMEQERLRALRNERMKTVFLSNISNALRTPLNSVIGFTDYLLMSDGDTISEEEENELLMLVNENGNTLLNFINELLQLSNIESSSLSYNQTTIDLNEVLTSMHDNVAPQVKPGVEFLFSPTYEYCSAELDLLLFQQVVTHFLSNAAKYTSEGFILLSYSKEDNGLRVEVTDSGVGVPKQLRPSVFNMLNNAETFTQKGNAMPGLGLSICKAIIEACNGKIGYEPNEGGGSRFWFWLPVKLITE